MADFNYYKADQQPYDFSPITRGAEAAAQIRANAMAGAAANILGAVKQRSAQRHEKEQQQSEQTFKERQSALERLGTESLATIANDRANMREVARQKNALDMAEAEHSFAFGQGERNNAARLEDTKVREQGWLDRTNAEYGYRAQENAAKQAADAKEQRAKLRTGAYASQFSQALDVAHADDEHAPIASSAKTRGEWLFPGLTESEIDVALKGMYHDPEQAKAASQYLKGKDTVRVFDPSKANAILDAVQQKISVPGEEDYAAIGRQQALENFQKSNKYAQDHTEGIDRIRKAFTEMYPPNYKPTPAEPKSTIGQAPRPTPISQAAPEDLKRLVGLAAKEALKSPTIAQMLKDGADGPNATPEVKAMLHQAMDAYMRQNFEQVALAHNWVMDTDIFGQQQNAPQQAAAPAGEVPKQGSALDRYEQYKKQNQPK
jgi:hypothetical protein